MTLRLDRIEIESVGSEPVRLAEALVGQLPGSTGPVPVEEIAAALDIVEITRAHLVGLEACLICDALKSEGMIVLRSDATLRRRRFSIAHELGHFLNEWHHPGADGRFACSRSDMGDPRGPWDHRRMEREANIFAIELLAPRTRMQPYLRHPPDLHDLHDALAIAEAFRISREAAFRRYVALHSAPLAVLFSAAGRLRYIDPGPAFPGTRLAAGDPLALLQLRDPPGTVIRHGRLDPSTWLRQADEVTLTAQTLSQADGYAATLLHAAPVGADSGIHRVSTA